MPKCREINKKKIFYYLKKSEFLKPNGCFQGLIHDFECLTLEALAWLLMIHREIIKL